MIIFYILSPNICHIIYYIIENYAGGPVGVETIATALSEERDTIETVVEPFLIQQGFLQRTPRGRVLTAGAYGHLGLKHKNLNQGNTNGNPTSAKSKFRCFFCNVGQTKSVP